MFNFFKKKTEINAVSVSSTQWNIFFNKQPSNKLAISSVYSCIRMISDSVAMTNINLYKKTDEGREEQESSNLALLLKKPSKYMTYFKWQNCMMVQLSGWGNSFSVIEYDRTGKQIGLIFIPTDNVSIKKTTSTSEPYYYIVVLSNGNTINVFPDEMIHYTNISLDGVTGLSPINLHANTLERSYNNSTSADNFVKNSAAMSGIITTDKKLKPEQITQLKEDFGSKYGGSENAGKIPVLGDGLNFTQLKPISPQDSEYINSSKLTDNQIMQIFKVPPPLLGVVDATYNNTEQLALIYQRYTLSPIYTMIEQELSLKLLSPVSTKNEYFEFNVDVLLNATAADKAEVITKLTEKGIMTLNEARRKYNLKDEDGLNEVVLPLNSAPLSLHEKVLTPVPPPEPVQPMEQIIKQEDEIKTLVHKLQSDIGRIKKDLGNG